MMLGTREFTEEMWFWVCVSLVRLSYCCQAKQQPAKQRWQHQLNLFHNFEGTEHSVVAVTERVGLLWSRFAVWTRHHLSINVNVVLLNRRTDYCVCQRCTSTHTVLKIVAMLPVLSLIHPSIFHTRFTLSLMNVQNQTFFNKRRKIII